MSIRDTVARHSDYDETGDFIPTPPWATRVLFEEVAPWLKERKNMSFYDPAAGAGHMVDVFKEYANIALGSDIEPRRDDIEQFDYWSDIKYGPYYDADHIVSNPPYKNIEQFARKAFEHDPSSVSLLCRIQFLESQARYKLFKDYQPTTVAVFSDRIPFKTGKVVRKAPKMFTHIWVHWAAARGSTRLIWIRPDAQQIYERDSDYES